MACSYFVHFLDFMKICRAVSLVLVNERNSSTGSYVSKNLVRIQILYMFVQSCQGQGCFARIHTAIQACLWYSRLTLQPNTLLLFPFSFPFFDWLDARPHLASPEYHWNL